jgi:hypothetical protein
MDAVAAGGDQEVQSEVLGEGTEDGVGVAVQIGGGVEAMVKTLDGFADGVGGFLGTVADTRSPVGFVGVQGFEFAVGFEFDGLDLVLVLDEGFEFILFANNSAHSFGIFEGEAALVEPGFAVKRHDAASGRVDNIGEAGVTFAPGGDSGGEVEGVDGFRWRADEEVSDVGGAQLVFKDGGVAGEDELPKAEAEAEGVERARGLD